MLKISLFVAGTAVGLASACFGQSRPPDLVAIRAAAEAGDPRAQYEYGKAVPYDRKADRLDWFLRSARAGYGPAEEELGSYFSTALDGDKQKRMTNQRESVRWSSRAAYHGISSAQFRIAQFYQRGEVLPKNRVAAYLWMRIADSNSNRPVGMAHKVYLDKLITEMSSGEIADAEARLKTFNLKTDSTLNPVEVDLLFGQFQLGAIYVVNGVRQVVVNNVRFSQGETKDLVLAGETVRVTCLNTEEKSILLGIAHTPYSRWLKR
jgi:hypothetical protein